MAGKKLSASEAKSRFGIHTLHEVMPNGEARLRLIDSTGGGYIQTRSTDESGWQNAHYHKALTEIYIVEKGWMGFCELDEEAQLKWSIFQPGEIVSSRLEIPHNVYLPENSTIHTVKIFTGLAGDWHGHDYLNAISKVTSESELIKNAQSSTVSSYKVEEKELIKPLMDQYTNLDRLIWTIPTVFISAVAVLTGMVSTMSKSNIDLTNSIGIISFLAGFNSLMAFVGYFSVHRLSYHHGLLGDELYALTGSAYLSKRANLVSNRRWLSAHALMKYSMLAVSALFLALFVAELAVPEKLNPAIFPAEKSPPQAAAVRAPASVSVPATLKKPN